MGPMRFRRYFKADLGCSPALRAKAGGSDRKSGGGQKSASADRRHHSKESNRVDQFLTFIHGQIIWRRITIMAHSSLCLCRAEPNLTFPAWCRFCAINRADDSHDRNPLPPAALSYVSDTRQS